MLLAISPRKDANEVYGPAVRTLLITKRQGVVNKSFKAKISLLGTRDKCQTRAGAAVVKVLTVWKGQGGTGVGAFAELF